MILIKKVNDLQRYLDAYADKGYSTGFVPTMGALHAGHLSLAETCKKENDVTVCSIFVNPTQFNDPDDFQKYPVTIENDILLLEQAGCDLLFMPPVTEIYPGGTTHRKHFELGFLETVLEGKFRPGHYQGVCLVVERLLEIVRPHRLYLGQKDYQQCMVINALIRLMGQQEKIQTVICPTLREQDGLAMSSRNMRLNKVEREKAASIYQALLFIQQNSGKKQPVTLKEEARQMLETKGFKVDYVEICEASSLSPIHEWNKNEKAVILIAAFINEIRLIDNMLVEPT